MGGKDRVSYDEIEDVNLKKISDANINAENIVNSAKQEAARIMQQAQAQADELMKNIEAQAFDEGLKKGHEQGYNEGYNKIVQDQSERILKVDKIAEVAKEVKKQIIKSAEKEIVELVILISEKLVKAKLDLDPDLILNIVKASIAALKDKEEVKIFVNPALSAQINEISPELKKVIQGLGSIKIIEDKTISPDGVIVESMDTRIDARFSSQIAEITKEMMSVYSKDPVFSEIPAEIEIIIEESGSKK